MRLYKPLMAALLAGLIPGCASLPSDPVGMRAVSLADPPQAQAATGYNSAQSASVPMVQSVGAARQPLPLHFVNYLDGTIEGRPQLIPTSLTGTMFEPAQGGAYPPISSSPIEVPNPGTGNLIPGTMTALEGGSIASSPGGPMFWIMPEPQAGSGQCVVLNDHLPGEPPQGFWPRYGQPLWQTLLSDERNFYSCCSLEWLAGGLGVGAVLANTNLDEQFRQAVHGPGGAGSTDLDWMKGFGSGQYVIPSLLGIYAVDYWIDSSGPPGSHPFAGSLEEWSGRSLRGLVVGAVPLLSLQYITGGSRPGESSAGSHWKPFQDNNGVSGHAFVGAVPFWTAAQMTDCIPLQLGFYGMGTLAGISRIHTDSHYLSQVVLGWWIAGLSVAAVDNTEWQKRQWWVTPTMIDGGPGVAVLHQW